MEFVRVSGIVREAPRVGMGAWAIGGWMWDGTDEQESIRAIHAARVIY
jgi:hypothetical protein